jgi:copper transport protein
VGAQPPANSGNQRLTGWIAISFDEPVDLVDSNALEVFGPDGKRIDRHDVKVDAADATRIVVHVPRALERGIYTVRWRVISADSHVVHGAYQIGIGVPVASALGNEPASPFDPGSPLASVLRWLSLMGALLAGGAIFLRLYVLGRLEPELPGVVELARRCTIAGAATVLAAWVPTVVVQAAAASGALGSGVAATLIHTSWGIALFVRAIVGLAILLAACFAWSSAARSAALLVAGLLATFSLTGHALGQAGGFARAVAVAIDFTHLCAAAIWIGGLFVLTAILVPPFAVGGAARQRVRTLFAKFTPVAALCVGLILATGIYASAIHVTSLADFLATAYGRLLLAKVAVFMVLLAFGRHHFRVGAGARLNRGSATVLYEALWGIVVVGLTALLVGQAPPASTSVLPESLAKAVLALICIGIVARFMLFAKTGAVPTWNKRAAAYLDTSLILAVVLFLSVAVLGHVVDITSAYMYPTLQIGDAVFVDRLTYKMRAPRDGEVVVLRPPILRDSRDVAQRIIGVGGDGIAIVGGVVYRNGVALREPYVAEPAPYDLTIRDYEIYVDGVPLDRRFANVPPRALWQSPDRIPRGFYFMLGDNREYSIDSHFWGFAQARGTFAAGALRAERVPVLGRALLVAWPPNRVRLLERSSI